MTKQTVAIIDYAVGNLFNVARAFQYVGARPIITCDVNGLKRADKLLLPGVGAFEAGMRYLRERNLVEPILSLVASGKPILGICLGMQLLMSESEEDGLHKGLDLVKGRVVRFQDPEPGAERFKIPQIGWNSLDILTNGESISDHYTSGRTTSLVDDLGGEPFMYFVHSYLVRPDNPHHWLAATEYGRDRFCSVLGKDNLFGCQFHPERSGKAGLRMLENFIRL